MYGFMIYNFSFHLIVRNEPHFPVIKILCALHDTCPQFLLCVYAWLRIIQSFNFCNPSCIRVVHNGADNIVFFLFQYCHINND